MNKKSLLALISLLTLIVISIDNALIRDFKPNSNKVDKNHINEIAFYDFVKPYITDKLKPPSSAKFHSGIEKKNHVTYLGDGEYEINS